MLSAALFLPGRVSAFWPFSTNAGAAASTFVPGSSTPALRASVNIDPNPDKGLGDILQTTGGRALLASGGPSGTIADVAGKATSDRISVYVVRSGDTLSEIADMFGVSANTILWANDLKNARDVHPGDTLIILPINGVERTIVKGDTLKSLAKKYGGDADEIAQYNGLDPKEPLAIGSMVIIPGGELPAPASNAPASRSSTPLYSGGSGTFLPGFFINPLPGAIFTQGLHGWNGIDLGAPRGTPIYAAASGTVIVVRGGGGWNGGYGNYIVIQHGNGAQTLYSHNSRNAVSAGQSVLQGQIIGYVGSTGRSTGTHLHFEVRGAANPFRTCSVGSLCSPK